MDQDTPSDVRASLLAAARMLLARGDAKFSVTTLCAEAGVERTAFRACFTGKAALLAALAQPEPNPEADKTSEPVVPAPDAWLERRLRVFERALNALESRAETSSRQQARAIAQLEERLAALAAAPVASQTVPAQPSSQPEEAQPAIAVPEPERAPAEDPVLENPLLLPSAPQIVTVSKAEMADVLQSARGKVRVPTEPEPPTAGARLRWLAFGMLSLATLFLCTGLLLGDPARATQAAGGSGISHRRVADDPLRRLIALADSGDARAQAKLALSYLRGDAVAAGDAVTAARWARQAALGGQPVGQYLLGTLYSRGEGVPADPVRAFGYFAQAASQGNVKAMHNLAIAYAEGHGTAKDEARAAQWFLRAAERGYVDSAFDLAVLHERGQGVAQDLGQALTWYAVAGLAGDAPSRARAEFLRGQLPAEAARRAEGAASEFSTVPALAQANTLPDF